MVCCSSAPPTTGMSLSPANVGQVVGARKQTCGRCTASGSGGNSSGVGMDMGRKVAGVDALELAGGVFDAGVGAHPAFLLRHDGVAVEEGLDDGARELGGIAAGH